MQSYQKLSPKQSESSIKFENAIIYVRHPPGSKLEGEELLRGCVKIGAASFSC